MKVLNKDGLSYFWNKIKNFLDRKQDKDFIVNVSFDENTAEHSTDKTFAEILDAYNSDKTIIVKFEDSNYSLSFYEEDYAFYFVKVEGYGHYSINIMSDNTVSYEICNLQSFLVSGTNIKTVNNNSLLGSGNIELSSDSILYKGEGTNYVAYGDSLTDAVDELSDAVDDLGDLNQIESITTSESTASGGNNTVTITETNGTTTSFNVKNGIDGRDGQDGVDGADGVSLGEIALVQTTGDSEGSVMSQSSVTKYGERINGVAELAMKYGVNLRLPEGYSEVEWIGNDNGAGSLITNYVPQFDTTRFVGSFERTNNGSANNPIIFRAQTNGKQSFYMAFTGYNKNQITIRCYNNTSNQTYVNLTNANDFVWHNFDMTCGKLILDGSEYSLKKDTSYSSANINTEPLHFFNAYITLRIGMFIVVDKDGCQLCLVPCKNSNDVAGMYDTISKTFYHESSNNVAFNAGPTLTVPSADKLINAESFDNMIEHSTGDGFDKLMSQKSVSSELSALRASCFQGRLTLYKLSDFPELDPRTADGISVVFATNKNPSGRTPMFSIWQKNDTSSSQGLTNPSFSLVSWDNTIKWGRLSTSSFTTLAGGYSFTSASLAGCRHFVFTYDFKTGVAKYYKNGVLSYTSSAPSDYSEQDLRGYFATCTHLGVWALARAQSQKTNGFAVFGSVLEDSDVATLYGSGKDCIKNHLVPVTQEANYLHPVSPSDWGINMWNSGGNNGGTATKNNDGTYTITVTSGYSYIYFGFNGITGVLNNLIYEWDFEVKSGSSTHNASSNYSRAMRVAGNYPKCFKIYDSNGNDVTLETLGVGTYHVVSKPDNVSLGSVNANYAGNVYLHYYFVCSSDFSIIVSNLKVTERGAALACTVDSYRGLYWEQRNGIKLPLHSPQYIYNTSVFYANTDTYLEDVVIYSNSVTPQFNGQMAVDTTNNKVYVGYLTGTGGTWKQINNS